MSTRPVSRTTSKAPTDANANVEAVDLEQDLRIQANPVLRYLYLGLGLLALGLAVLGALLPGMPTTIWLIIATFFFVRSSPKLYSMVVRHRLFGPLVRDFRAGKGMPKRAKIFAISMITIFAGGNAILFIKPLWLKLLVLAVAAIGILYILSLPTKREATVT